MSYLIFRYKNILTAKYTFSLVYSVSYLLGTLYRSLLYYFLDIHSLTLVGYLAVLFKFVFFVTLTNKDFSLCLVYYS